MKTNRLSGQVYIYKNQPDLSWMEIHPGEKVVLKPNLVKESVYGDMNSWQHVITSEYIIRLVSEYVAKKLEGKGEIYLCDAPQTDSSFKIISERLNFAQIKRDIENKYSVQFNIIDLRDYEWKVEEEVVVERHRLDGDPNGKIAFNLDKYSLFYKHAGEGSYYGADYEQNIVNSHHQKETHEYLICGTPIKADVFINLPKLKTHKKTGVTLNLKNLVGINADKNWLPHHIDGSPKTGGDQFPDQLLKNTIEDILVKIVRKIALKIPFVGPFLAKIFRKTGKKIFGDGDKTIRSGNWYGNDTTWRMALDLNRCLLYGNMDATFNNIPKRYYSVVDGILGMEGNGPMDGSEKKCNVIIGGYDPVAVDTVCATLMGFDWEKIPIIKNAFFMHKYPITDIEPDEIIIISDEKEWSGDLKNLQNSKNYAFEPHFGWKGHIEL
jgi:uncharacterized protein (DUF362 family)